MIKLLLVEDDANLRYIIRGGLEDMIGGYEIKDAANGEEGLKVWQEWQPDVIVSDIEMPVMDGYEMVKRIRETDPDIPILFSSGRVSPKDVKHASGTNKTLTARETKLLQMLCEKKGEVVKRETILEKLWGTEDDYFASRSLDVFVTKLRKLFAEDPSVNIKTVKGIGLSLLEI